MIGQTIAHYKVTAKLGAGGMGEVYRATDTKLGRDVALKVLPAAFAQDEQRMARLQREAQVLASLNHPNIAAIYGIEGAGGGEPGAVGAKAGAASGAPTALVMELVEGPTLGERIREGALSLEETLSVAVQIAEALECAHEKGIIHRDLKPANIKLTFDGKVKVLDFGLAKALSEDASAAEATNSPTMSMAATRAGIILGTAAYMAPEQAAAKPVDRRADIWSFGVVLWEMLTGQRLFAGETVSHTLADVLRAEIDFGKLPADTPHKIRALLQRCLDRDAKARLRDIGEARIAMQRHGSDAVPAGAAMAARPRVSLLAWAGISALGLAAITGIGGWYRATRPVEKPLLRFSIDLGPDMILRDSITGPTANVGPAAILSPDGSRIAFTSWKVEGVSRIFSRRFDQPKALPVDGTEGGMAPFFSPDSRWIGFFAEGKLKKTLVEGGPVVTLCEVTDPLGAAWAEDGSIILSAGLVGGLVRVPEAGGAPQPLTKVGDLATENSHRWPQVLPDRKGVLFAAGFGGRFEEGTIAVQTPAGVRKDIYRGATFPRYLPNGYLTFVSKGTLFAAPFDLERLQLRSDPVPMVERVRYAGDSGGAQVAFSSNGMMIFREGSSDGGFLIALMERGGKQTLLVSKAGFYRGPILSPDGKRLALLDSGQIATYDLARDTLTRITFSRTTHTGPRWTPDGRHLAYATPDGLYWTRPDGAGTPHRLIAGAATPAGFTADGKRMVYLQGWSGARTCWTVELSGDPERPQAGKPEACFATASPIFQADLSPDGRWLAYSSTESGKLEVYVRSFPDRGGKWQVSSAGGQSPAWSPKGGNLFFALLDNRVMVSGYTAQGDSLVLDRPSLWADVSLSFGSQGGNRQFSVARDGQRLVVLRDPVTDQKPDAHVVLFENFFDEVNRRASATKRN